MHACMPTSELVQIQAVGHCPHLSALKEPAGHLEYFLATVSLTNCRLRRAPGGSHTVFS